MDFDLTHEQRQILEYGNQVAQKFDRKYWMECAEKHVFPEALYRKVAEDGFVGTMVPEVPVRHHASCAAQQSRRA